MYSCTFWNEKLAGRYLEETGLAKVLVPSLQSGCPSPLTTLEVSGIDAYLALMHWRRSCCFRQVDSIQFQFSEDETARNIQLSCLADFFASLPPGVCHFRILHLFLSDFEFGINIRLLSNVLYSVHRTGCVDFWIYSSYLSEEGICDVGRCDLPENSHAMERVAVQSSCVFSKTLLPWFAWTLESGSSLTSVDISSVGMTSERWSALLPRITLPRLQALRLVGLDLTSLTHFLARHPSVRKIHLDGVQVNSVDSVDQRLALPNLNTIEGDEARIACFLALLDPTIPLRFVTLVFRNDCNSLFTPRSFDGEAFATALRLIGELQEDASTLVINVSSDCGFASSVYSSRDFDNRPERRLSLFDLNINIFGSRPEEILVRNICY